MPHAPAGQYWDYDTQRFEPCIAGTPENWENQKLGTDARYARAVSAELTAEIDAALGLPKKV